jgi:SAM-dependent methyltransferase
VTGADREYSLYHELASWWPLISPPSEYAADAAVIAAAFESARTQVRTVLDLGSGGGHIALHLKLGRSLTLVDLSEQMLEVSRKLNPDCVHVQGDMRTIRLGELFDGVLAHDAIDYVTSQHDLRLVIDTAFAHCRPGGVAVFAPDYTAETFRPGTGGGGGSEAEGGSEVDGGGGGGAETGSGAQVGRRQASFREHTSDPDPADEWILAEYEFTLRQADGRVRVERESHQLSAFHRETWLRLLAEAGFTAKVAAGTLAGNDVRSSRVVFIGYRPG